MKYIVPAIILLIAVYPLCKVTKKMGHHPLLGLFFLVPGVNIVMLYIFASAKWPIEYQCDALIQENSRLREKTGESEQPDGAVTQESARSAAP